MKKLLSLILSLILILGLCGCTLDEYFRFSPENNDSDDEENPVYPRITIKQNNSVIVNVDHEMITNNTWVDKDYIDGTVYCYDDGTTKTYYYNKHEPITDSNGKIVSEKVTATKTDINPVTTTTKTSVVIKNKYIDEVGKVHTVCTKIKNNASGETIVLDGANRVVSSSVKRVFGDNFDWQWLPMYNGKNEITVIGNCTITFEYRSIRKIGEY